MEECSQPECGIGRPLATMRLVRVERCFQDVLPGTSLHGGELRGGVATSLGGVLVANSARRGQAPPWRKITLGILNLVPFHLDTAETRDAKMDRQASLGSFNRRQIGPRRR